MSYSARTIYLSLKPDLPVTSKFDNLLVREPKRTLGATPFVIGDICICILLATTAALAILAAGGVNLDTLNILGEIPLPANVVMLTLAGVFIIADCAAFTVKKLTKPPPDPGLVDLLDDTLDLSDLR